MNDYFLCRNVVNFLRKSEFCFVGLWLNLNKHLGNPWLTPVDFVISLGNRPGCTCSAAVIRKSPFDSTEREGTACDVCPKYMYILGSISKSISNEPARRLDFGKATVRLTGDFELDGDDTSDFLSIKWRVNERKQNTM